ncbi:Type II secretion system protein H [Aquicella siphonis]|uniref:Type II secretion system protein H n=1 Tax=Aquicella siphonis TaxID=254247 RepID=A0A5E4PEY3_9COXI|nr:type II secretion system minor pseudopilin GspH [Aquicella siphonis]VVC75072.1 Type II secretion system protein H [Aquicella siphonis]
MKRQCGRSAGGFTLIEILVVIFIISIVTSVALLTVSRNENRQIESFTHELVQLVTLAEEQAMLQPVVLGLALDEQSYQFSTFQPGEGEKKPSWTLFQDKMLGPHRIPEGIQLGVEISGQRQAAERDDNQDEEGKPAAPQVIISTNGDITPFTIYVGKRGKKPRYVITGDADGRVTSKLLS